MREDDVLLPLFSGYVLLAALKNGLFPTGTLLGGTNPHVSLIATYLQQAARQQSRLLPGAMTFEGGQFRHSRREKRREFSRYEKCPWGLIVFV